MFHINDILNNFSGDISLVKNQCQLSHILLPPSLNMSVFEKSASEILNNTKVMRPN